MQSVGLLATERYKGELGVHEVGVLFSKSVLKRVTGHWFVPFAKMHGWNAHTALPASAPVIFWSMFYTEFNLTLIIDDTVSIACRMVFVSTPPSKMHWCVKLHCLLQCLRRMLSKLPWLPEFVFVTCTASTAPYSKVFPLCFQCFSWI